MSKGFSKSIGGGNGSAPVRAHSLSIGGNFERDRVGNEGAQPSEPTRKVTIGGPNKNGFLTGDNASSGADAKSKDSTAQADKLAKSKSVRV